MFKKIAFLIVLATIGGIFVAATTQCAKTSATQTNPSQTRFEQFLLRNGRIMVLQVVNTGTMRTRDSELTIEVIRLEDARSGEVVKAAKLIVRSYSTVVDPPMTHFMGIPEETIIDESELDELLEALTFFDTQRERLNQSTSSKTGIYYSSVGGLKAGISIDPSKRPMLLRYFVTIGGRDVSLLNSTDFTKAMTEAQRVLKSM